MSPYSDPASVSLGFYRHFKGALYEVIGVGKETTSLQAVVVYRSVTEGNVWIRPLDEFLSSPDGNTPRFTLVAPGGLMLESPDFQADVAAFHAAMCPDQMAATPSTLSPSMQKLRADLIREECDETLDAIQDNDLPRLADGIADAIYVLMGTAIAAGIDISPVWREVQRANMAKLSGPIRADGKRLKPADWRGPDIDGVLTAQGWVAPAE